MRDFVNTTDHEPGIDDLTTPAELTTYLHRAGLIGRRTRSTDDDLALARQLGVGLRHALELNHVGQSATVSELETAPDHCPGASLGRGPVPVFVPADDGVRGGLTRMAIAMSEAVAAGSGAAQDLLVRRVRMGLLRQVEEPLGALVRVRLRRQAEDARLPREAAGQDPLRAA